MSSIFKSTKRISLISSFSAVWAAAKNRYRPLERFSFARLKLLKQLREYFTRYASLKRRITEIHTPPQGKLLATTQSQLARRSRLSHQNNKQPRRKPNAS